MKTSMLILLTSLLSISSASVPPVRVGLYYESLCPDSKDFILNQLYPTYQTLKSSGIMSVELYPYGNANYTVYGKTRKITFSCQHGEEECKGNILQACDKYETKSNLELVQCMFASKDWRKANFTEKVGKECATKLNLDWDTLENCLTSDFGQALLRITADLTVVHTSVPWVTIDGKYTDDMQKRALTHLLPLVCDSYKGEKPKECN